MYMYMRHTPKSAVREPVQVYLARPDRTLLDRVAEKSGLSRAEVLRRGLRRLAAELLADEDPMSAFMREMAESAWPGDKPTNVAQRHHEVLAEAYLDRHKPRKK